MTNAAMDNTILEEIGRYPSDIPLTQPQDYYGLLKKTKNYVDNGGGIDISTGLSKVYKVNMDDMPYVLKLYREIPVTIETQKRIFSPLEQKIGGFGYRIPAFEKTSKGIIALEKRVLENWEKAKIHAPRVIASNGDSLLLSYVEGTDYEKIIQDGEFNSEHLDKLIGCYAGIREEAFAKRDIYTLHNDPYAKNFMFGTDGKAVAIDPGLPIREDLPLEELDARINLFFCLASTSPYFGYNDETKAAREAIQEGLLNSFDEVSLRRMLEHNIPTNILELAYFRTTSFLKDNEKHFRRLSTYNPESCRALDQKIMDRLTV